MGKAFPPKLEPRYDRQAERRQIVHIFYPEDNIRARFYEEFGSPGVINLNNEKVDTPCQRFINKHNELSSQDLTGEELWEKTVLAVEADGLVLKPAKAEPLVGDIQEKAGPGGRGTLLHDRISETIAKQQGDSH